MTWTINPKYSICLFVLFMVSCTLFYLNFPHREYGWDMPGYLGSYYKLEYGADKSKILDQTYSSIKKESPQRSYQMMVGFSDQQNWKHFIANNPEAFYMQIPYYSIKMFYVLLVFGFVKIGFSPPLSVLLPNMFAFFLLGFLLFEVFKIILKNRLLISLLLTLVILFLPHFRYLARIPTPDMLSLLLIVWFLQAVLKKYSSFFQAMILVLIICTRPDFIVFAVSYWGMNFLYNYVKTNKFCYRNILYGIATVLIYCLILQVNDYPGWKSVFYDSFIQRRKFAVPEVNLTFQQYLDVLFTNLVNFKRVSLMAVGFLGIVLYFSGRLWVRLFAVFLYANLYLKFLFFPSAGNYRFFSVFLLMLSLWALKAIYDYYFSGPPSKRYINSS